MSFGARPVIGFLTDFGLDGAAATCRAVILSICPDAQIVDISHTIRKFAVADGAYVLGTALPWFGVGVHLAVVDPGVGTERRAIGIRVGRGDLLIGPDNGLLAPAADALGGVVEARELANRDLWLPSTSATFHGRDVFAPVAARLACGKATFDEVGPLLDAASLVRPADPGTQVENGAIRTRVAYVDTFGNARLVGGRAELESAFGPVAEGTALSLDLPGGARLAATIAPSFGSIAVGATLLYVDSSGNLALAENQGDLARRTGLEPGMPVTVTRG
jgi:S-adenosylmethionine hydrolase